MTRTDCTVGLRGRCPGGVCGTVDKISSRPNARWPILVKRDDGLVRSYAPSELTKAEPLTVMGVPLP